MTRREIVYSLVATLLVASVIACACLYDALRQQIWTQAIVPLLGVVFIACFLIIEVGGAVVELRQRTRDRPDQEHP